MGLGDFIMIIDNLGLPGVILVVALVLVMLAGSIVDIYQFFWMVRRVRRIRMKSKKVRLPCGCFGKCLL